MSSGVPSLPPSGGYIAAIRESARALRVAANIQITPESIQRLLQSPSFIESFNRVSKSHGLALPLKFASPLAELNLLSVLSLLNFASGYRIQLHAQCRRGAWDSIRALVLAMYITSASSDGDMLSAAGIESIRESQVAEFMGINLYSENPHPTIPGVMVGVRGGPLLELVELITKVLNETGQRLRDLGYPDLGTFVVECLKAGQSPSHKGATDVEIVLEKLVTAIPAFQDMAIVNGQNVFCFKKALFLVHAIHIRFGALEPPPFPVPSTSNLPVFTDNVLPSLLVHLGVLDLSQSPLLKDVFPPPTNLDALLGSAPSINKVSATDTSEKVEGPVLTVQKAYILRAAAIDACEMIVATAHTDHGGQFADWVRELQLPELDMWLWAVAKDRDDYRKLPRFVLKNTVFF